MLKVGAAQATTVEVTDVALQMETESSQRDQTITNYQSAALPLVSRNYTDLLALVTGVRQAPTQATTTSNINSPVRAGAYNVNGQRSIFNNFLLDGMDNNSYGESNQGFDNQIISVPPDSVAHFSVVTNNESAEYGRSSAATINVASQSGGNKFHATLYEFLRNTDLNAPGFFKPITITTAGAVPFKSPRTHRNQYGGDFGGPILHDKMFFFLDYEGLRAIISPLYVLTLPTQNELNGILSFRSATPLPALSTRPARPSRPAPSIRCRLQIVAAFKSIQACPQRVREHRRKTAATTPCSYLSAITPTRAICGWIIRRAPLRRYFLRVSDRKETGINFPTIPLPLEGQTAGHATHSRPANRARIHGHLRLQPDPGSAPGALTDQSGQDTFERGNSTGHGKWRADSWPAHRVQHRRRSACRQYHRRIYRVWPSNYQSTVPESSTARS